MAPQCEQGERRKKLFSLHNEIFDQSSQTCLVWRTCLLSQVNTSKHTFIQWTLYSSNLSRTRRTILLARWTKKTSLLEHSQEIKPWWVTPPWHVADQFAIKFKVNSTTFHHWIIEFSLKITSNCWKRKFVKNLFFWVGGEKRITPPPAQIRAWSLNCE